MRAATFRRTMAPIVGLLLAGLPAGGAAQDAVRDLPPAAAPRGLSVDSANQTLSLALEVTAPAGSPSAVLNGYRAGGLQVTVPLNWTVRWEWRSADSTALHSLVVMVEREKVPFEGGRAAFTNAMTRMVTAALRPEQGDTTAFLADQAGWYWMLCGVPGHAILGEWIELRVDPEARTPSAKTRP
jgi:Sulfocyanin (SoxE) domain